MEKLNKKTKKKMYFVLVLVGIELLTMGILCIANYHIQRSTMGQTCVTEYETIVGCPQNTTMLNMHALLIFVLIINLILGIYLIVQGAKTKQRVAILVGIISFIPLPGWFFAGQEMSDDVYSYHTWDKPVLYLYPEHQKNVTVTFEHPENLLTTYPKYESKWEVTATPEGSLYDENEKYYYALYWDEKNNNKEEFKEGFYVTKENAIEFLETTLTQIGLTRREQNEFIMYWLPVLEENEKSLVNYTLTEERQEENKLMITPKPDSLLRVAINIKKVDKKVNIREQQLPHFTREGFTAVEWGGAIQ